MKNSSPLTFVIKDDFDLQHSLDGGQAFRWWKNEKGYRGVIGRCVVNLCATGDGVSVEYLNPFLSIDTLTKTVNQYLGLEYDLIEFKKKWGSDPCIGPSIRGYRGLRVLKQDPWECLFSFICSSTNNAARIKMNITNVAVQLGEKLHTGTKDFAFPDPYVCASAGEGFFRNIGLGFRAKYVVDAARKVSDGSLDLYRLRDIGYLEAREKLMTINGVGGKIADCVLAFSLDKRESFPVDRHILRAIVKWYGISKNTTPEKGADWGRKKFGKHSSVANQYIFHRERLERRANLWGGKHTDLVVNDEPV
jgi:N-glycosylase/DNA lyase|tara:strand:+ start:36 stop:953 length:918 start_codon:yes stop_codon:yes gene_type:complete